MFYGAARMQEKFILNIHALDKYDKYDYCRYLLRLVNVGAKLTQRQIAKDLKISLRDVNKMAQEMKNA